MKQLKNIIIAIGWLVLSFNHQVKAQENTVFPASIKGTVVESATGKPISGAQVTIAGVTSVLTGDLGEFELKKSISNAKITFTMHPM